ncbi:soluble inorganic pyrophosphatase 6, chloroplastic-like [Olea europaea subsp. europaea]|uniref:inorganic diphosphatase n=1 Tax=Olea europaea subsp. europaea TaxID=158383 RepID=A0A8S0PQJ0_OLEEU|nr:soluble inorganic pyrophosphatase 6, chloroplastic-like [Olea europaea subsp. europaea]
MEVATDDPSASLVSDIDDVEKHFPGTLTAIRDWFRDYKIPDGKPANKFGLGNKAASKDYALKVITETNESWAKLVTRSISPGELSLLYVFVASLVRRKKQKFCLFYR